MYPIKKEAGLGAKSCDFDLSSDGSSVWPKIIGELSCDSVFSAATVRPSTVPSALCTWSHQIFWASQWSRYLNSHFSTLDPEPQRGYKTCPKLHQNQPGWNCQSASSEIKWHTKKFREKSKVERKAPQLDKALPLPINRGKVNKQITVWCCNDDRRSRGLWVTKRLVFTVYSFLTSSYLWGPSKPCVWRCLFPPLEEDESITY